MKKVLYLLLLAVLPVVTQVNAQNAPGEQDRYAATRKKLTFAIQPMQLFNNALRLDFETRLGKGPGWLQFGPAIYLSTDGSHDTPRYYYDGNFYNRYGNYHFREPYTELTGGGIDINYKYFLNPRQSFYTAVGVSFAHFNIKYWGENGKWQDFMEDGLQYYKYVEGSNFNTQRINRPGVNFLFGYQIPSRHAFLFDMFWGVAARYSFSEEGKPAFNEHMFSYGYTGLVFLAGIRVGFGVK
jgi:hypothetical protein